MNILRYFFIVTFLLGINYVGIFLVLTFSLIRGVYLNTEYLDSLILVSQFAFLVRPAINTFSKISGRQARSIRRKVSRYKAITGIGFVLFSLLFFDLGIYMDLTNNGLDSRETLQIYFIIHNLVLGSFLGSLLEDLIHEIKQCEELK